MRRAAWPLSPIASYWLVRLLCVPAGLAIALGAPRLPLLDGMGEAPFIVAGFLIAGIGTWGGCNYAGRCPRCGAWMRETWSFPAGFMPSNSCGKCNRWLGKPRCAEDAAWDGGEP